MSSKISLLDCTLRDGAYIVNSQFGSANISGIIAQLEKAGVEIIECGWLKNEKHREGSSFYHIPDDLLHYIDPENKNATYVAMIDWDRYNPDILPRNDGKSIDAIRVVFPHGRHKEGIAIGQKIRAKGYAVYFQAANTLAYSDEDLSELADEMNAFMPEGLSVVDTFGAMYEEDLEHIIDILASKLDRKIKIGFHSHNNQQLSFSLTVNFTRLMEKYDRECIVDASLCGMGRGAGNATTELVVSYLNRKCAGHYNLDAIMDAIDIYMTYYQQRFSWGYSTEYFIAGLYCTHVNNIAYLIDNHRVNAKDMRNIIESLSPEDRRKYDYDLLESKYIANQSRQIDDAQSIKELKEAFKNKNLLLIAPGKSVMENETEINEYAKTMHSLKIGVNAFVGNYDYDYVLFVNPARYEYAQKANAKKFENTKKIILSNIKQTAGKNEIIINFDNAVKRGFKHFDNAVICALRLLDYIGINEVGIAGFDGFKNEYNESYADAHLPSLNNNGKWDELNSEIKEMYSDFKEKSRNLKKIHFITESIYNM
jgi:4-hydroxy 2-oxovalerate aldolase